MKRTWIGVVLALSMAALLTGCGGRDTNGGSTAGQQAGSGSAGAGQNGNSSISQDIGAADDRINGSTPSQSGMTNGAVGSASGSGAVNGAAGSAAGSGTYTGRTAYSGGNAGGQRGLPEQRGGMNPFLQDGRYRAYDNGRVEGRINPAARDFTEDARGMIRDAGNALGDAGRSIGDAAADVGRGVRNAARDAMQ